MNIDIDTRFITLIGTPLRQSFAARMQNAGYSASGLNLCYFYTETDGRHLKDIITGIKYMPSFAGCAVTKPNKVDVLKYLDELDPLCEMIGACNTVVKRDGRLIGYNTDGIGFIRSIREEGGIEPKEHTFFCFGAGGAGRAVCCALACDGAKRIFIMDRDENRAEWLVEDINTRFSGNAVHVPQAAFESARDASVLINATGLGMGKTVGESPLPENCILPEHFCYDTCYNPVKTQFLLDAERKGAKILNGLGMSLYQGAEQIRLWSGREAPIDVMRQEIEEMQMRLDKKV